MSQTIRTITLGGGCFWCIEAVYLEVRGITAVESGYTNGHVVAPTYEQVCSATTGHAEVVRLSYDPQQITLRQILEIFFVVHDPTTPNRQGNDVGPQYRSGIYVDDDADIALAQEVIREVEAAGGGPVVTEVRRLENYSRAEDYHQRYFRNHPNAGYCAFVVAPKVRKFQQTFADLQKTGT